ncbi:host specificity protein J, partial [Moraxella sp. VT-16-12]|uniref:host specificity protein J n=1 Tax=Moraxella sp. VT-16-12 TaxID=2014877 RepID=UPI0011B70B62
MNNSSLIHGSKKGSKQPHRPHIAPDTLVSQDTFKALYGLCEGEIYGLADGGKSIKLDGTPLINDNGQPNFTGVNWEFRAGTLNQTHIAGFPAVENETNVGVELRHDRPWVKAITNRELSAVRVRLNFNALREQDNNGNIKGYAIEYAIDVQTDGGSFIEVVRQTVRGKSSAGYKKSHRIDLPSAGTAKRWTIRVRRITPNRNSDLVSDTVHIDALTEIIDAKLAYPCTAVLGLSYNAKTFSNIAKIAVRLKGKIIQVPSNYNADTRQYNGLWDGTFKMAYSNNPAWVYYDICTHKRYGLGERLSGLVDKWRLYQIGQYCDELVDDGKGGREPRFAINVYIQKAEDAYLVLQNIASVFRGMSFWDGSNIVVDADTPKDPIYTFSRANVVGGEFVYQGTRARDRHTLISVAWSNPDNEYKTEYEPVADEQAIARYGIKKLDIAAWGCTSKGQAQRAGLWALKSEQLETQTVSFKTGLMGFIPQVGQVINIADDIFAGRAISGRIVSTNAQAKQLTLDRQAGKVGDTITLNTAEQVQTAKIVAVNNTVLTLDKAIGQTDDVWAIISDDLKLMQFRILSIAQNDDATFDITALQYARQKYDVVDSGANIIQEPLTVLKATPITAPNSVTLMANTRTHQGQAVTTLTINWEQVQGATAYIVEWRKDDGNWQTLPKVAGQSVDIDGVYAGAYLARVRAVDSFDNESLATSSQLTHIAGKTGRPPKIARLNVQGKLFGMDLAWVFNKGSDDTNFTEIQVSPDGRSNITTLGTFAYPTNKHEITGLQGNLTQFYRARIVDKLGNTSDWTAWVRGTSEAQADKVLDLIQGQISQSHL